MKELTDREFMNLFLQDYICYPRSDYRKDELFDFCKRRCDDLTRLREILLTKYSENLAAESK